MSPPVCALEGATSLSVEYKKKFIFSAVIETRFLCLSMDSLKLIMFCQTKLCTSINYIICVFIFIIKRFSSNRPKLCTLSVPIEDVFKVQRIRLVFLWIMTAAIASVLVYATVDCLHVPNKFSRAALQSFLKYWRALKSSLIEVMALKHTCVSTGWFGLRHHFYWKYSCHFCDVIFYFRTNCAVCRSLDA
jgi:hypothetical protein